MELTQLVVQNNLSNYKGVKTMVEETQLKETYPISIYGQVFRESIEKFLAGKIKAIPVKCKHVDVDGKVTYPTFAFISHWKEKKEE